MLSRKNVPETIRTASRQNRHFQMSQHDADNTGVESGQIWSTWSHFEVRNKSFETEVPRLVVIVRIVDDHSFAIVPVSMRLDMATDFDLIVSGNENTLGFRLMVEVWNETTILRDQLRLMLGTLSDAATSVMRQLYRLRVLGEPIPDILRTWTGLPLFSEDDVRHIFQQQEIEALEYLSKPTLALMIDDELEETKPATSLTFDLKPFFDKLSNFLSSQIAYASGISGEAPTVLLTDEERRFVFEILHRKRQAPYMVHMRVVALSPSLESRRFRITLSYSGREMQSGEVILHSEQSIQLGEDRQFDARHITNARVEIE